MKENDIQADVQFGYKSNYSTTYPIFILNALIERQLGNKHKVYCCFIDFKKAYDFIDRDRLWYKLIKSGVDGNDGLFQGEIVFTIFE